MAAGDHEVLCVRQGDGAISWRQTFDPREAALLQGFQVAGGSLYFFVGASRFSAWEIANGRCLWCDWAPGSRLGLEPPAGCFAPRALVSAASAVLGTGSEKPLILDSRNGARLHQDLESDLVRPIVPGSETRLGLLTGREAIQAVELADGRPSWRFLFDAPQALAGEMPQVLQRDDRIFVQIAYNYGYLLELVDGKTGKRHWPAPLFVGPRPLDLELGDVDEGALYCSSPGGIEARGLADGQILWKQETSSSIGRRRLQRSGSILLNLPSTAEIRGWEFAWHGIAVRFPSLSDRACQNHFCAVHVLEPRTGQCLQSLNVAKPESATTGFAIARRSFSLCPVVRALGSDAPAVLLTPDRLLVVQGQAVTAFDVTTVPAPQTNSANAQP